MYLYTQIYTYITTIKERRSYKFEREWEGTGRIWGRRRDENDVNIVYMHEITNKMKKKDL